MKRFLVALVVVATAVIGLTPPASAHHKDASWFRGLGYTQVVVAPDVYALVAGAGITPAPLDGAKAFAYKGTLAARFPITAFTLRDLTLTHSGGLSLSKGGAFIELRNFDISLARGAVSAEVSTAAGAVGRVDVFTLGFSDRYDLGLVRLSLTEAAAGALNATFGVTAFATGATFGYATPRPFATYRSAEIRRAAHQWVR